MKYRTPILLAVLVLALLMSAGVASSSAIPTLSIVSVARDQTVTFRTFNYPPNQTFTVTMGPMGTRGVGGSVVGAFNSGAGGSFTKTFNIPAALQGSYQISIRAQTAHFNPYYSYNWFYNNTTTGATGGVIATSYYIGIPTFNIVSVEADKSVTVQTNNYPVNQTFTVTMGPMGTRGIGGIVVGSFDSGAGGSFSKTFDIPAALHGSYQISIRAQTAHVNPYYSFNWFYNNNTAGSTGGEPAPSLYIGIPTFKVCAVEKDKSVTIFTNNYPKNQTFTVKMGLMGTRGIGGTVVGTFDSGDGGAFSKTFNIPANLQGLYQISIRAQTAHVNPYYSYNWFYNNTASVCG